MSTIETLKARATERRTADAAAVAAAARLIASGGTVADVVALETAMAGAGVDVEGFDKLVAVSRARAADRLAVSRIPDAEARVAKLTSTMERIGAERQRAIDEAYKQLVRLEADVAAATAVVTDGRAARDRLLRDVPGIAGERLAAARTAHREADVALAQLREAVREEREAAARHTGQADDMERLGRVHPGDIDDRRRAAVRAAGRAAEAEAGIPAADKALAAAVAALRAAEADALEA
jgi:hypothetical protein